MLRILYRIVRHHDNSFAVAAFDRDIQRHFESGFKTEAEAEAWAAEQARAARGIEQWERKVERLGRM